MGVRRLSNNQSGLIDRFSQFWLQIRNNPKQIANLSCAKLATANPLHSKFEQFALISLEIRRLIS